MSLPYSNQTTSKRTAKKKAPKAPTIMERIWNHIDQHGRKTRFELARELGIPLKTADARAWDLVLAGRLLDLDMERADPLGEHEPSNLLQAVPPGQEQPLTTTLDWEQVERLFRSLGQPGASYGVSDVFEWLGKYFKRARLNDPMYVKDVPPP